MRRIRLGVLATLAAFVLYVVWVAAGLPARDDVRALASTNPRITSLMRQREREAKRAGRPVRRVQAWIPIGSVSRHLIHAVISSEDQKFFGHEGVDWDAIKKSMEEDSSRGRFVRGGSTITQQLAKNLFFTTEKSLTRKLRELVAARWLEQDLSKKRILELYLNVIEWGDGIYGAQAAAQRYYGKPASDLGPEEAAGLAGMIPNPRRINPLVDARKFGRAQRRALWLMANAGYIERSAAGLGAEPPPVEAEEDEPEPPAARATPPAEVPEATPAPAATPETTATPPATPESATPEPATPEPSPTPGVR
jgi:monofunctional biosynthetic peptidoglycan transglycosylase